MCCLEVNPTISVINQEDEDGRRCYTFVGFAIGYGARAGPIVGSPNYKYSLTNTLK